MDVVVLQVFVSLMLALGSVLLFVHSAKQRDHEHAQRLALLPLEAESVGPANATEPEAEVTAVERGGNSVSRVRGAGATRASGEQE